MGKPGELVRSVERDLNRLADLAASDLTQFENCVARGKSGVAARERYEKFLKGRKKPATPWMPPAWIDDWKPAGLRMRYEHFVAVGGGACIDFALAAAYLLGVEELAAKVRVEVVSWSHRTGSAHAFVIVGRKPVYQDGHRLGPADTWTGEGGDAWYLVDGWAGAMGHRVVYRKAAHYPYRPMLAPLTAVLTNRELP